MARSLNMVLLVGNAGADPKTRDAAGKSVTTFKLATTTSWGKGDERKENTEWHTCVAWGNLSNIVSQIVHKGGMYHILGRLHTRKWHDEKTGTDNSFVEIVVQEIIALSSKGQSAPVTQQQQQQAFAQQEAFPPAPEDDLPF